MAILIRLPTERADFALGSFIVRLHLAAGRIPAIEANRVLAALSTIRAILDPRTDVTWLARAVAV